MPAHPLALRLAFAGPLAAAILPGAAGGALAANAPGVQKTTLQQQEFPGPVDHTVLVRTVIGRGAKVAPHTHPGAEMAYIESGQGVLSLRGREDQPLKAGASFAVPPETVHSVRNTGQAALVIVSTYVVDKTKPIAAPAK